MRFEQISEENNSQYQEHVLAHGSFLQDFSWGDFQKSQGKTVYRFAVFSGEGILASAQAIENPLSAKGFGRGKIYLFMPYGPVVNVQKGGWIAGAAYLFEQLRAKFPAAVFLRFEPQFELPQLIKENAHFEFKKTLNLDPAKTLLLDLSKSEQELLSEMSQSTRRKLRTAEKVLQGGELQIKTGLIEDIWQPHQETAQRAGIRAYPAAYYQALAKYFAEQGANIRVKTYSAWYRGQVIASNLMIYYKSGQATYLFGGSSDSYRDLAAPFLLQWQAIKDAKNAGFHTYDFWGIEDHPGHSWAGITQFKRGFGGRAAQYSGTFDWVLKPAWYNIYRAARKSARTLSRLLNGK